MAAGDYLTWAVQSQDAPAHVARILQTILLNEGVVDVAGGSFEVAEDTGSNMNITIGSGTLGDLAVIEGDDTAGQGVYVIEAQNATVTKTIAASDPSDDRIDLVVLQNYDDEADSSGNNDAEVEVIEGTPAGSPSAPSLPDSAIPLAEVTVGAGVTAITNANITDTRVEALVRAGAGDISRSNAGTAVSRTTLSTTFADFASVTFNKPAGWNEYEISAHGWAHIIDSTGPDTHQAKVVIGADVGASVSMATADNPKIIPATHVASGLTAETTEVKVQARNQSTNDGVHRASQVSYVARRTG